MIEVEDLVKRFDNQLVLDGVNLRLEEGVGHVILGRSGTGKSVLLKHLIGLLRPDRGRVFVDGDDVSTASYERLAAIRMRFGMLFQTAALFDSMTVGENIALGLREHRRLSEREVRRIVAEKLALVGLPGIEARRPAELSGGMRKRVGLARAIALDPRYVLFDEPTTGLDPVTSDQIDHLILALKETLGITCVIVTHDLRSAYRVGDHLYLLHGGRVIFSGTPAEIRAAADPMVRQFVEGRADGPMTGRGLDSFIRRKERTWRRNEKGSR